ncbi:MAG: hypothetical protein ACXU82_03920 [Caulobacteraceae bacterium]
MAKADNPAAPLTATSQDGATTDSAGAPATPPVQGDGLPPADAANGDAGDGLPPADATADGADAGAADAGDDASSATDPVEETGWLIERAASSPAAPEYLSLKRKRQSWSHDHLEALRFARRVDAEDFAALHLAENDRDLPRFAEHAWSDAPADEEAPAE